MKLKVKKLSDKATIPSYSRIGDGGLDLTASSVNKDGDYIEYGTDLSVEIPLGHIGFIFPRSSISNRDLLLCNAVGVIDSGFRGEIKLRFKPIIAYKQNQFGPRASNMYNVGDRIGQLVILPFPTIEVVESELSESKRGSGGFGHTGL
jgi:dUTP pyrophosphatase